MTFSFRALLAPHGSPTKGGGPAARRPEGEQLRSQSEHGTRTAKRSGLPEVAAPPLWFSRLSAYNDELDSSLNGRSHTLLANGQVLRKVGLAAPPSVPLVPLVGSPAARADSPSASTVRSESPPPPPPTYPPPFQANSAQTSPSSSFASPSPSASASTSSPPRRLQTFLCAAVAALATLSCDVASEGRGTAVLAVVESAVSAPSSTTDARLHASAARILSVLSRSSDALRDLIVAGPLVRFLTVVLQHSRGPALLPRSVALRSDDARVLVDSDVLHDGSTLVLACQAAAALASAPGRAQRLHHAALPAAVLWLMSKHPTFRESVKMQRLGVTVVLAVWCCRASRAAMLRHEGLDDSLGRALDMLEMAVAARRWGRVESGFVQGLVDQVRAQRADADCLMS